MTEEPGQTSPLESSLLQAVARTIDLHRLIPAGAGVVVGVSGGMDSVVLLSLLHRLAVQPARRWRLGVAHMDHGLRDESEADARFVEELARKLGLPCASRRCDVRAQAAASGQGIEQAGRQLRYEFLLDAARRSGAACVAVAHHADDNAETVLYRVLRGTALHGLAGMPIRRLLSADAKGDFLLFPALCPDCRHFTPERECSRDSDARQGKVECPLFARREGEKGTGTDFRKSEPVLGAMLPSAETCRATNEHPGHASADGSMAPNGSMAPASGMVLVELVRPLLECRRSEIERYAREYGLAWREDASNADVNYRRNFIRHELLPAIREKLSTRADEALLRLAQHAGEIDAFLAKQAGEALVAAEIGGAGGDAGAKGDFLLFPALCPDCRYFTPERECSRDSDARQGKVECPLFARREGEKGTGTDFRKSEPVPFSVPFSPHARRFDADRLAAADAAVQAYAMRMILEQAGLPMRTVGQQRIVELRAMLGPGGPRAIALGHGLEARRDGRMLIIGPGLRPGLSVRTPSVSAGSDAPGLSQCDVGSETWFEVTLAPAGETVLPDGGKISCAIESLDRAALSEHVRAARQVPSGRNLAPENFGRHVEWLDADELRGPLVLRPRRDGDAFEPLGCAGGKSVSDFLTDLKLAHSLRRQVLCLCDELGVVCLWPIRIDRRVRVTDKTTRVLKVIGR